MKNLIACNTAASNEYFDINAITTPSDISFVLKTSFHVPYYLSKTSGHLQAIISSLVVYIYTIFFLLRLNKCFISFLYLIPSLITRFSLSIAQLYCYFYIIIIIISA